MAPTQLAPTQLAPTQLAEEISGLTGTPATPSRKRPRRNEGDWVFSELDRQTQDGVLPHKRVRKQVQRFGSEEEEITDTLSSPQGGRKRARPPTPFESKAKKSRAVTNEQQGVDQMEHKQAENEDQVVEQKRKSRRARNAET